MELKDNQHRLVNRTPNKDNEYINTALNPSSLSLIHVEENEYEVLRRETESTSDKISSEKAPPKPYKRLIYVLVGIIVPLYIAVAAVTVVLIIPKGNKPINGAWSTWGSWGNCSATCDFGMERRERSCTDPVPNTGGGDCTGEPTEYRLCNKQPCAVVNGNWTDWSSWGSCSATCDFGMERRERMCTRPKPGVGGDYCAGEHAEYRTCKISSCRAIVSSFVVDQPKNITDTRLTFSRILFQQGSGFNVSTGTFTCSVPGTYLFSVNLLKMRSDQRVDRVYCTLFKKYTRSSEYITRLYVDPTDDDTDKGNAAVSSTVVTSLKFGEYVYLSECTNPATTMESWSSFTGVLLYPDS